ncbi:ankyrin repeat domain-containing protein [Rickettsiella endosymbiont of Miltochrista miniata]|uniref:ankyrin repeat domain-containing protein n=1 Tax=Rickettsiella endosymbiont of Miltochrista miniata TaxID=3066239 RepID=UPI00313E08C4
MPNNNIISPEQRKKCIRFLVAAATGNLTQVKDLCDEYTLNASNSKGNTALHLASENNHDDILKFLFRQPNINLHQANIAGKKTVDIIAHLSTAALWQKMLTMEKNIVQGSVFFQKNQLKKNYAFELNTENISNQSLTIDDLSQINAYVKQALPYGAPNWDQEQFPHQQMPPASRWKKKDADYYRIDVLQDILLSIQKKIAEELHDTVSRLLAFRIVHSSLAEVLQVGRCDEQVAVAFNQLLFTEKKGRLQWIQAINLREVGGQNFIIIDKEGGEKPETWKSGLLIDPMDDRVESLQESAPKLMEHLVRIISQPDTEQIKLIDHITLCLPFKAKHHASLAENLARIICSVRIFFESSWHLIWPEMKKEYPRLKEKNVKTWLEEVWKLLDKNVDIHAAMVNKLQLDEIQNSLTRLEQRFEVLNTETHALALA